MSDLIKVYSPSGEVFENSPANARDLVVNAGWTYEKLNKAEREEKKAEDDLAKAKIVGMLAEQHARTEPEVVLKAPDAFFDDGTLSTGVENKGNLVTQSIYDVAATQPEANDEKALNTNDLVEAEQQFAEGKDDGVERSADGKAEVIEEIKDQEKREYIEVQGKDIDNNVEIADLIDSEKDKDAIVKAEDDSTEDDEPKIKRGRAKKS